MSCIISLDVFQTDFKVRLGYTLVNTKRFIKKSYKNITTTCTVLTWDDSYDLVISSNILKCCKFSEWKLWISEKTRCLCMRILQWKVKLPTYILKMSWEKEILILTETYRIPFRCNQWMPYESQANQIHQNSSSWNFQNWVKDKCSRSKR